MDYADQFYADRELSLAAARIRQSQHNESYRRGSATMDLAREDLLKTLKPSQKWEYEAWLTGFLRGGGKVTHFYDYPWPGRTYTALSDLTPVPLYGARSLDIIVPEGIIVHPGQTGHCNVYIMDRFRYQGFHDTTPHTNPRVVPAYTDTELI